MANTAKVYAAGTTTTMNNANIYLFNATDMSQSDLLTLLYAADASGRAAVLSGNAVDKSTLTSAGAMTAYKTSDSGQGTEVSGAVNLYYAVLSTDGSSVFLSNTKTTAIPEGDDFATTDFGNPATASKAAVKAAGSDYSSVGAGWYVPYDYNSSGGVPEPTSGLLLALGGAMLALRRRRS